MMESSYRCHYTTIDNKSQGKKISVHRLKLSENKRERERERERIGDETDTHRNTFKDG